MEAIADVVSLGERLRQKRSELGMSQAQAARELDVARTAYRLWEMEAAKPSPDRWRLISRWLGVSVATMLLAEDLVDEGEAAKAEQTARDAGVTGQGWDDLGSSRSGSYFDQERATILEEERRGSLSTGESGRLSEVLARVELAALGPPDVAPGELRKVMSATKDAPSFARSTLGLMMLGSPPEVAQRGELLVSELVTNAVVHGDGQLLALSMSLTTERLRVEVANGSGGRVVPRASDLAGFGLRFLGAFADRWGAERTRGTNLVWFEIDL